MPFEHIYLLIFTGFGFLLIILLWLVVRLSLRISWLQSRMEEGQGNHEKLERVLRADMADNRRETNETLRQSRAEFNSAIQSLGKTLNDRFEQSSRTLEEKLLGFQSQAQRDAREGRTEQSTSLKNFGEQLTGQLQHLTQRNNEGLDILRQTLETKLTAIQTDNSQKLEQMRLTVDEKLHNTLEQRLGDSFKLVSDRLEQVHKGLGEMQALASGVGDLKKVLTNVKIRGTWGEVQLDNLLEQVLSPEQYAKNVVTRPNSNERVEFAIKLPGRNDGTDKVWLPIDAKFPLEDYQKLMEAQDLGDIVKMEESRKALESRIREEAKTLRDKYLEPPFTTDFGLLFLPIEGLYAEVIRRPGLSDYLQRECRVTVTGPTTLTAILNSLQMGFRTLAIEKRSSEVWQVLGAVKTEFGKFGEVLAKTKKKLDEARNTIDEAEKRSRSMDRKLRQVESLPVSEAQILLDEVPILDN
jgi:DNA recombination protein RmuC